MAAYVGNPDLLIRALNRFAGSKPDPVAYLNGLLNDALTAMTGNGDEYATRLHNDGAGSEWMRDIPPNVMAQLAESALQRREAGNAANGLRTPDFSQHLTTLG